MNIKETGTVKVHFAVIEELKNCILMERYFDLPNTAGGTTRHKVTVNGVASVKPGILSGKFVSDEGERNINFTFDPSKFDEKGMLELNYSLTPSRQLELELDENRSDHPSNMGKDLG